MFRIKAHLDGARLKIDGVNPAEMKPAQLKKECAKRGLSPMGYPDELLESLIAYLKANPPVGGGGDGKGAGAAAAAAKGGLEEEDDDGGNGAAVALVHRILALRCACVCMTRACRMVGWLPRDRTAQPHPTPRPIEHSEAEDWGAILSLGAAGQAPLTRQSPTTQLRKAYHRLSLNVHPDKLRGVGEATRAFQAVVTAFERLSAPEEEAEEEAGCVWGVCGICVSVLGLTDRRWISSPMCTSQDEGQEGRQGGEGQDDRALQRGLPPHARLLPALQGGVGAAHPGCVPSMDCTTIVDHHDHPPNPSISLPPR